MDGYTKFSGKCQCGRKTSFYVQNEFAQEYKNDCPKPVFICTQCSLADVRKLYREQKHRRSNAWKKNIRKAIAQLERDSED